jgi:uncharacterized membrane protein YjjP (DUF1212 family)
MARDANARGLVGEGTVEGADQALATAALVFESGGSINLADTTLRNVLRGLDLGDVSIVYRMDFIAARVLVKDNPRTILQPLRPLRLHLVRASEVALLAERLCRREIDLTDFAAETERIRELPSPHSRWVTVLAAACAAAGFSQTIGGDWEALAIAAVAASAGQYLRSMLQASNLSSYTVTFLCALTSGFIAVGGLRLGLGRTAGATLFAAIIYVAPGVPLINGFIDMVSGRHLIVGVQRFIDATFLFFLITVAVAIADSML